MKTLGKFIGASCCLIIIFLLMVALPGAVNAQKIKIGILGPMAHHFGTWLWNAATLTSEEINESGGINIKGTKYQIELVKYDTNELVSIPDAVSAMERAIAMDKCDFLMGGARTEAVLAMQDVAAEHKIIYIDTGSINPQLVERVKKNYSRFKYYFRTCIMNGPPLWGYCLGDADYIGQMIKKRLGLQKVKVAIIIDKAAYAEGGMVESVKDAFTKSGYEVVGVWRPAYMATDLYSEANAIKASGAHLIFATLAGPGGPAFVSAWGKLKIPAAVVGTITASQNLSFWKDSGGSVNYLTSYDAMGRVKMSSRTIPFYDKHLKRFGTKTGWSSPYMDGAILALKAAIERAGTLDADALVKELEKTDVIAANGRLKFLPLDSKYPHQADDRLRTLVSFQWRDGNMTWYYPPRVNYKVPSAMVEANPQLGELGKFKYDGITDVILPPWLLK